MSDVDEPSGPSLGPNESASQELGGQGEWPDPDTPPSSTAPGSDPQRRAEIVAKREGTDVPGARAGTSSSMSQQGQTQADDQSGQSGAANTDSTDEGNAEDYGGPVGFKDTLDDSGDVAGSGSIGSQER